MAYTANGRLASIKDAEANLTSHDYDGFDRMVKTCYPMTAQGAGASTPSLHLRWRIALAPRPYSISMILILPVRPYSIGMVPSSNRRTSVLIRRRRR